jgi:hypothetical protein
MQASLDAWESVGFTILARDEADVPSWVRLTDGQVIVMLMTEAIDSPALAYFHPDPPVLRQRLHDRGAVVAAVSDAELTVEGPGGIPIYVHKGTAMTADRPTKEASPLLGYFGGIAVSVTDADAAKASAERMGFLVAEFMDEPFKGYDMTDGSATLLLQQTSSAVRPLVYATEFDDALVSDLTEAIGDACTTIKASDGSLLLIKLRMPEGTTILVQADD